MKNKKMIILISAVILILIIAVVIVLLVTNKDEEKNPEEIALENRIIELLENDYKYYYYMYGDIKTGEGGIETEDGERYEIVNDENLITTEELNSLIEDTFLEKYTAKRYNAEGRNEYLVVDNQMYVKKGKNVCSNIVKYNLDNIIYNKEADGSLYVLFDNNGTYMYEDDSGTLKMGVNVYYCIAEE